jgi:phthalate 4,5-dioxygenase oxygenase subunit
MTTREQNELLTQTGPGTPMGDLFRRYWMPTLLAEELPEPDCPPVRVKLLSERLLAFRDSQGRLGLIDEFCAHRGVSLWFGRNEENGLRCRITAGSTIPAASASKCRRNRPKAATRKRSSSRVIP